jgi:two-component system response regulator FixJ
MRRTFHEATMTKRTIYIVDDHTDFREATRFWLSGAGFDVQAFGDPQEAVEGLSQRDRNAAACLMLDVHMPQLSGLDVHDALVERGVPLPVIYMSGQANVPLAVRVMQKGAVSLLEKPFDDAALEAALDRAFASPHAAPAASPAPAALGGEREQAHARFVAREAKLTPREREVLGYVILGVYNKNIADRIGLSIKTVELYRARGMAKMQAHSVAELTRMMVSQQV